MGHMSTTTSYLRPLALLMWLALAAGVTAVMLASPTWAATLTVNTASDVQNTGEDCSLREAVIAANTNAAVDGCAAGSATQQDTIGFDLDPSATIALASQLPTITDAAGLTVDGASADITISGADQVRVFEVGPGAKLTLGNLTVAGGDSPSGSGGGILNNGTLKVRNTTFSGNSAGSGGGIDNDGTATVSNSTLSGNSASGSGGGILNSGGATLTVTNSTFFDNSADMGGGIDNDGTATLRNTIVANRASSGNCSGKITDGGYNLSSDASCGFTTQNKSLSSTNPLLGPLEDNGGPTPTHALLKDSPAIDKGKSFGATTDQRGLPRPFDLGVITNATRGDGSDIGAYEQLRCSGEVVHGAGAVVGTLGPDDDLTGGPGNDTILGLGGSDKISGRGGDDTICAGKGNDRVDGGDGGDVVEGSEGKDFLHGGEGEGKDFLYGLKGEDTLKTKDGAPDDLTDGGERKDVCKTDPGDTRRSC